MLLSAMLLTALSAPLRHAEFSLLRALMRGMRYCHVHLAEARYGISARVPALCDKMAVLRRARLFYARC